MRLFAILPLSAALVLPAVPAARAAAPDLDLAFATDDLTAATLLPVGAELRLRAVPLVPARDLELRRIQVFAPDARLTVQGPGGERRLPVPDNAYFSGAVAGEAGSRVSLGILASGEIRGVVGAGGGWWMLAKEPADARVRVIEVDPAALADDTDGFRCETDRFDTGDLLAMAGGIGARGLGETGQEAPSAGLASTSAAGTLPSFTARVAFETDQEFLSLFGGSTASAIDYIGDLVTYGSTIYEGEVDTNLLVSSVNLWQSPDPWTQSSTACRWLQFGRYWNDNNGAIDRTIAHFLSGQSSNSGIAWVGVLCDGGFNVNINGSGCTLSPNVDSYGGGYGYSGGIDADFDPGDPEVIWDFLVVTHEIGHNFNSPHTHCYNGLGGNANPVDECYNGECTDGCYCGSQSRPGCSAGEGCGTIMSYCHLLGGGLANISPTFGLGFSFGVDPDRVPTRMNDHVVARAGANPGCLDLSLPTLLFADGFESGDTLGWSSVVD